MIKVTAVLLKYRRFAELEAIEAHLRDLRTQNERVSFGGED